MFLLWFSYLWINPATINGPNPNVDATNVIYGVEMESPISFDMINQLSFGEIELQTGKKLTIKEKVVLGIAKRKFKKSIKKGTTPKEAFESLATGDFVFEWKIFLWSILLGPLALIYVFAAVKRNRRSALASSGMGCLIWLAGFITFLFMWSAGG